MSSSGGASLLHRVAVRILAAQLRAEGYGDIVTGVDAERLGLGTDIAGVSAGRTLRVKVKADPYLGDDRAAIDRRDWPFYRGESDTLALEAVADSASRAPGWAVASRADRLWYYRIAIPAPQEDVRALLSEPDAVFFSELPVATDDLLDFDMARLTAWFAENMGSFPSRPVVVGDTSSWHRLVPREPLTSELGPRGVGQVFDRVRAAAARDEA